MIANVCETKCIKHFVSCNDVNRSHPVWDECMRKWKTFRDAVWRSFDLKTWEGWRISLKVEEWTRPGRWSSVINAHLIWLGRTPEVKVQPIVKSFNSTPTSNFILRPIECVWNRKHLAPQENIGWSLLSPTLLWLEDAIQHWLCAKKQWRKSHKVVWVDLHVNKPKRTRMSGNLLLPY